MKKKYNQLLDIIYNLQAQGRYTFALEEIKQKFRIEAEALKKSLNRLSGKGIIVSVRKGFYVIVPPEYSAQKLLPPPLFIDDLMSYIRKPYYVGLLSAAALNGAAHQQPQEFQVITRMPALRNINVRQNRISFFTRREFSEYGIVNRKTDNGYIKISGPELTAIDLIQFQQRIGGISRVLSIIDELAENLDSENMKELLKVKPLQVSSLQRLGFLLEKHLGQIEIADTIYKKIKSKKFYRISLTASKTSRHVRANNRWKVAENVSIESDL